MCADSATDRLTANGWTSAVELRQLRALLAVVEHGSIGAAAITLGLAQSTVSEALAGLERAIGTPLLRRKRGAHAIGLTDSGDALLPHARRVLQEVDALHSAVATVTRGAMGHVRISANESVGTYILAPALTMLRKRWPKVRFFVTVGTCPMVRGAMATGAADLGLLLEAHAPAETTDAGRAPGGSACTVVGANVSLTVFARRDHPLLRHSHVHSPDELAPFSIHVADSAGDFHDLVSRYLTADGLPGPRLEPVGSIESVKRGVADDPSALGLLPAYAIAEELGHGTVRALALRPAPPDMRLMAIVPSTSAGTHPVIRELLAQLSTVPGGPPPAGEAPQC